MVRELLVMARSVIGEGSCVWMAFSPIDFKELSLFLYLIRGRKMSLYLYLIKGRLMSITGLIYGLIKESYAFVIYFLLFYNF